MYDHVQRPCATNRTNHESFTGIRDAAVLHDGASVVVPDARGNVWYGPLSHRLKYCREQATPNAARKVWPRRGVLADLLLVSIPKWAVPFRSLRETLTGCPLWVNLRRLDWLVWRDREALTEWMHRNL